jgi:hypothetical protein
MSENVCACACACACACMPYIEYLDRLTLAVYVCHQARRKAEKASQAERLAKESLSSAEAERDRLRTRVDALMAQVDTCLLMHIYIYIYIYILHT